MRKKKNQLHIQTQWCKLTAALHSTEEPSLKTMNNHAKWLQPICAAHRNPLPRQRNFTVKGDQEKRSIMNPLIRNGILKTKTKQLIHIHSFSTDFWSCLSKIYVSKSRKHNFDSLSAAILWPASVSMMSWPRLEYVNTYGNSHMACE